MVSALVIIAPNFVAKQ